MKADEKWVDEFINEALFNSVGLPKEQRERIVQTAPLVREAMVKEFGRIDAGSSGKVYARDIMSAGLRRANIDQQHAADAAWASTRSGPKARDVERRSTALALAEVARRNIRDRQAIADGISRKLELAPNRERADRALTLLGDEQLRERTISEAIWGACGMPTIEIESSTWAAQGMTDTIAEEVVEQVRQPWPAFMIKIPHGALRAELGGEWVDRVMVSRGNDLGRGDTWCISCESSRENFGRYDQSSVELCSEFDDREQPLAMGKHALTDYDGRMMMLVGRLVISCVLELDRVGNAAARRAQHSGKRATKKQLMKLDRSLEFVIGKPVIVDVRPYVEDFLRGARPAASGPKRTRTLVRGHWKNQPFGPGRAQRKFIHIDPYWSVSDDSLPVAVRPHILKGTGDAQGA